MPDLNGDGFADIIVGSPTAARGGRIAGGVATVYFGRLSGIGTTPARVLEDAPAGARFGWSVASAGDINGDGYADLMVGAPTSSPGGRRSAGSVWIYLGGVDGIGSRPALVIEGQAPGDELGKSISSAGDVNADGYADLILGAPSAAPGGERLAGSASVFLGSGRGILGPPITVIDGTIGTQTGFSVSGAGDVNGDGYSDIVVGAPYASPGGRRGAGVASVFLGSAAGIGPTASAVIEGPAAGDTVGFSVANVGDMNGDGFAEVIAGAPFASPGGRSRAGMAFVYNGSERGIGLRAIGTINGVTEGDQLGWSVAAAGDLNGDGYADTLAGSPFVSPGGRLEAGAVSVYLGGTGGLAASPSRVIEGFASPDHLGQSTFLAGDTNGDTFDDLLIGAPHAFPAGRGYAGTASIFHGGPRGIGSSPFIVLEGEREGDNLGHSVAAYLPGRTRVSTLVRVYL
ncbi:MAG: FG-GAP repeat protein [Deltaproteobacteria bacterium]|nr:FG-GAP repeat protein [Deltaproteobacteria bacterium]